MALAIIRSTEKQGNITLKAAAMVYCRKYNAESKQIRLRFTQSFPGKKSSLNSKIFHLYSETLHF